MTCELVFASYSLPELQAVKLTFFVPCLSNKNIDVLDVKNGRATRS